MSNLPEFSRALLRPRCWLLWLGIGFLWLLVQLPYPVIYRLGTTLGRLAMQVMESHTRIARRNLELCFPKMSAADREALLVKNFESLGMGLMETGMAWFWPTHWAAHWTETSGVSEVVELLEQKQGILLIGIHFLTPEMGVRVYGMFTLGIGVCRLNDSPLVDWLQTWEHLCSNKTMLDRKDLKEMVRALKEGKIPQYAPDHDYGPTSGVFAPLFVVEQAATITGTWMLAKISGATTVPFVPRCEPNGMGYGLISLTPEHASPLVSVEVMTAWISQIIEQCVLMAPEQCMWLHRCFRTRSEGVPPRYWTLRPKNKRIGSMLSKSPSILKEPD